MYDYIHGVKFLVAGECGLAIQFGHDISPEINLFVQRLTRLLQEANREGISEVVPTYRSVMVYFDPLAITRQALREYIEGLIAELVPQKLEALPSRLITVPVCYGGVLGPDLEYVSRYTGLSAEAVVKLHTSQPYLVYMLGFTPGFPYLGSLADELVMPRKEKPLPRVPAGSVGIAGNQTGFYPGESQGEWWLIGRTPLKTIDLSRRQSFLVAPGDYVQFQAIALSDYFSLRKAVAQGKYQPNIVPLTVGDELRANS